jgi:histidinol-phosphate phosphatase family protein
LAGRRRAAAVAGAGWAAATAEFAWRRIAPGPRTPGEIAAMLATSALIPPLAILHRGRGYVSARLEPGLRRPAPARSGGAAGAPGGAGNRSAGVGGGSAIPEGSAPLPGPTPQLPGDGPRRPAAVLFDRDGTLVHDVPYNGDPERVRPQPHAAGALARLRAEGIRVGVVSNQSGVARGLLTAAQVEAVNRRVESHLGALDGWFVCLHGAGDGCDCRKPRPGLIRRAARALGVSPQDCLVIGDVGADVEAAQAAGARAILVPTPITRPEEIAAAPAVARDLREAVEMALAGRP